MHGPGGTGRCCGPIERLANSLKGSAELIDSNCGLAIVLLSSRLYDLTTGKLSGLCVTSMQLQLLLSSFRSHQVSLPSSCCNCTSCCRRYLQIAGTANNQGGFGRPLQSRQDSTLFIGVSVCPAAVRTITCVASISFSLQPLTVAQVLT